MEDIVRFRPGLRRETPVVRGPAVEGLGLCEIRMWEYRMGGG